jgi:hypothetical protein
MSKVPAEFALIELAKQAERKGVRKQGAEILFGRANAGSANYYDDEPVWSSPNGDDVLKALR